ERSLMQIAGRAARNARGRVIFYGDRITDSMKKVLNETERRRTLQREYNEAHGITPQTIIKSIEEVLATTTIADARVREIVQEAQQDFMTVAAVEDLVTRLEKEMKLQAKKQQYEKAAQLRDEIQRLREQLR
ncbi:excinuclease ABC subunit B, partial [candidate division KSB1 bacterium]